MLDREARRRHPEVIDLFIQKLGTAKYFQARHFNELSQKSSREGLISSLFTSKETEIQNSSLTCPSPCLCRIKTKLRSYVVTPPEPIVFQPYFSTSKTHRLQSSFEGNKKLSVLASGV